MIPDDYLPGESLECTGCRAVYLAAAVEPCIATEEDARCICCGAVMTHWPQSVRFEMIETADEANAIAAPLVANGLPSIRHIEEAVRLSRRRDHAASNSGT